MTEVAGIRSLLFVPASDERKLEKARTSAADALILDLEDAVAPGSRPAARDLVRAFLEDPAPAPAIFVRPQHPSAGELDADLAAAAHPRIAGIVLPKAESAADVNAVAAGLDRLGASQAAILPLLETGRGIHEAYAIADASPRCAGLAFSSGEQGDYMADIDGVWTPDGAAMSYARGRTVNELRAAGRHWAVDGVFMSFRDPVAFEAECRLARSYGFQAKMAIHPDQLATIHRVFTPSEAEVDAARRVLDAHATAIAEGRGAVQLDGVMIDQANVLAARRVLAKAEQGGRR
jgi:citrate lyase subunit beta/citryl-CoA lyase